MQHFTVKKDSDLQQDVINEIKWDPRVSSSDVSVFANNGIVTLKGSVPHYYEKSSAENAAQRVSGVRAVVEDIEVDLMGTYKRSDEQIAEAALSALAWSYATPKKLKVTVEKGWITLKGEAEWEFQRSAAKDAVSPLMGVCGVTNMIAIKPKAQPAGIKALIESALKRSAEDDARNILVSVHGDKVTLTGTVKTLAEIEDARLAAWMAPGVVTVENKLIIQQ